MASDTRNNILAVAAKLFAQQGFEKTSISAIAKGAGVSDPSVFRHFKTKENLLLAVFRHTRQQMNTVARLFAESDLDPVDTIVKSFESLSRLILDEEPDFGTVLLVEGRKASARGRPLVDESEEFSRIIEEVIRKAQEQGVFRKDINVQALRQAILGVTESLVLGRIWEKTAAEEEHFSANYSETEAANALRYLLEGLKPRGLQLDSDHVDAAKQLLLFELKLETKRYELFASDPETEGQWQQALKAQTPKKSATVLKTYRDYKHGLFKKTFDD